MSIQVKGTPTHISQHLQDLINVANASIKTFAEQILEIYHTAKKEGFTPEEARILIDERVVTVSSRYLREILPDEAKNKKMIRHKKDEIAELAPQNLQEGSEDLQESKEKDVNIPTNYDIKDAESEEYKEKYLPEPTQELPQDDFDQSQEVTYDKDLVDRYVKEISRLEDELAKLNKQVTELKMQKVGTFGNKFEFPYSYEMPSGDFVPFIVTVFPDKKDGYIRLDKEEIKRVAEKEAKRK